MKKNFRISMLVLCIFATLMMFSSCDLLDKFAEEEEVTYELGDEGPAGGIIFYVNPNAEKDGWTYLEAYTMDLDQTTQFRNNRICFGYYKKGSEEIVGTAKNTGLGAGKENTEKLYKAMGDRTGVDKSGTTEGTYAAQICYTFNPNGHTDWYLPSVEEVVELLKFSASSVENAKKLNLDFTTTINNQEVSGTENFYYTSNESLTEGSSYSTVVTISGKIADEIPRYVNDGDIRVIRRF